MAESIVSFAIEKLATFLVAEAEMLGSLSGDVRAMGKELATIKEVLKDAERKAEEDDTIKVWLKQVREIGYDIEDVVDEYVLLKEQRQQEVKDFDRSQNHELSLMITRLRKWLGKVVACFSDLKPKHKLASQIKDIKKELVEISERRERYQFITTKDDHSRNHQDPRISSLFMDDSEIFGIEDHKAEIINWLNLEEQQSDTVECSRSVIAVVGMGGIGKSTLVRKVYKDNNVRKCFNFYAWVNVSQSYEWKGLLKSIFNQVRAEPSLKVDALDEMDEITIIEKLRNHLKDHMYMVVFDDVWDVKLSSSVKAALPSDNNNSRILMTTRDKDIAHQWKELGRHHLYVLEPLPQEVAWDLFCHKIFGNAICPPELEPLSREMVKKCDGVPLAIVAIAGFLSTKNKDHSEWNRVHNALSFEIGNNKYFLNATKILLLSYHELPYYLRPCFLYFGMLPEGHFLDRIRLIRLWIAEGFIQNQRGRTLEEVAEEYLNQLVHRNLIQVRVLNDITGKKTLCWVHGILREMIILPKLENLSFCHVLSQDNVKPTNKRFRRLSIHSDCVLTDNSIIVSEILTSNPGVRSLLWFVHTETLSSLPLSSLLKDARFLKVLDLEDAPIDHIPEDLKIFQHLHYLSVKNTKIKAIPESIGELQNLQTLNLKRCYVVELPREISRCKKLRHLLTYRFVDYEKEGVKIHDGVLENLNELQKLAYVEVDRAPLVKALDHLKHLRRLGITKLKKEQGRDLCHAIEEMKHLRSLSISSIDRDEILDIQYVEKSPPLLLECLYLEGRLEKLPNWVTKLKNLSRLFLVYSRLENDPLKSLVDTPNLVKLTLQDAYVGEKLDFGFNKFSKLELLGLFELEKLKSLVGVTLPALRDVVVLACPLLHDLPSTIPQQLLIKGTENYRRYIEDNLP